jgi:Ni,Fe-hydrogenase maturation factor
MWIFFGDVGGKSQKKCNNIHEKLKERRKVIFIDIVRLQVTPCSIVAVKLDFLLILKFLCINTHSMEEVET